MSLSALSIKRPTFITSVIILMLIVGYVSLKKLRVDLFPNINFPIIIVSVPYPGAGPNEGETLIAKILEDEVSTLSGVKTVRSVSKEGIVTIIAEFSLKTDIKYAEQQIRDRVSAAKRKLPSDIKEPIIRRIDPSDQPILVLSISADLTPAELYDFAEEQLVPHLTQSPQVGLVELVGGRKREIHVLLEREKLKKFEVSVSQVAGRLAAAGQNIPAGKITTDNKEFLFRTLGEYNQLSDIRNTVVNFIGNDVPITINQLGKVTDELADETTRGYLNGKQSLFVSVYRQSGANTIEVAEGVLERLKALKTEWQGLATKPVVEIVQDFTIPIRINVEDVQDSILIGITLTIIVVFLFLGSFRSTLITGLALPNSLLGAFILMAIAGFSINIMTLLALSLSVGLLVDDAIVVRENIFRHNEMGKHPVLAALIGTKEVVLAVVATTLTVIAVFGPIAFLQGMVGQFFREFGATICFAMLISLFDSLTIAPMLSAYFARAKKSHPASEGNLTLKEDRPNSGLQKVRKVLFNSYDSLLRTSVRRPWVVLLFATIVLILSFVALKYVPKTFLPAQDFGEFAVSIELEPGSSLESTTQLALKIDSLLRRNPEISLTRLTVGNRDGETHLADFYVRLVDRKKRSMNTSEMKEKIRTDLKEYSYAKPQVKDYDMVGGGRPFQLSLSGTDEAEVTAFAQKVFEKLKNHAALKDVDLSSRPGKPEFQIKISEERAGLMGISSTTAGTELRAQVEGVVAAKFREKGREYDLRVRMRPEERNLKEAYQALLVPNVNGTLIPLANVSDSLETVGPANINRQDRNRFVMISADVAPDGPGMGGVINDLNSWFAKELKLPPTVKYSFVGQAQNFKEMGQNIVIALVLGTLFIFLVLASLYESFVTPLTIMIVLPLAACGAFFALFITHRSLDIYSWIGIIMLFGIATKNSILLVDYAAQMIRHGANRSAALIEAGHTRLRPILMTSFALIAGMLPVAIGLNEASKQRTSMGIAVIGGLISSTLLTLVVVPAAYAYLDRFRLWSSSKIRKLFGNQAEPLSPAEFEEMAGEADRYSLK